MEKETLPEQPITITQSMDMFHDYILTSRSAHTARAYNFSVHLFAAHLKKNGIDLNGSPTLMTSRTFEQFPIYLLNLKSSKRSLITYLAGFTRYRRWLIRERLIPAPDAFEAEVLADTITEVRARRHARLTRLPQIDDADRIIQAARDIQTLPLGRKEIWHLYSSYSPAVAGHLKQQDCVSKISIYPIFLVKSLAKAISKVKYILQKKLLMQLGITGSCTAGPARPTLCLLVMTKAPARSTSLYPPKPSGMYLTSYVNWPASRKANSARTGCATLRRWKSSALATMLSKRPSFYVTKAWGLSKYTQKLQTRKCGNSTTRRLKNGRQMRNDTR